MKPLKAFRYDQVMLATWIASIAGELPIEAQAVVWLDEESEFLAHCVCGHVRSAKSLRVRGGEDLDMLMTWPGPTILCASQHSDFVEFCQNSLAKHMQTYVMLIRAPDRHTVVSNWCLEAEGISI